MTELRPGALERDFSGSLSVLDFDETRMVLGGFGPNRTFWWNTHSNATQRILGRAGYAASISGDRVASFTRDPYNGGCSMVTRLSDPSRRTASAWCRSPCSRMASAPRR